MVLSLMIVLQTTSGQESTDTSKVSYTHYENRRIAAIMLNEELLSNEAKIDSAIISEQKHIIEGQFYKISNLSEQIKNLESRHSIIINDMVKLSNENISLSKSNKNLKILGFSTSVSTLLLLIIIML